MRAEENCEVACRRCSVYQSQAGSALKPPDLAFCGNEGVASSALGCSTISTQQRETGSGAVQAAENELTIQNSFIVIMEMKCIFFFFPRGWPFEFVFEMECDSIGASGSI